MTTTWSHLITLLLVVHKFNDDVWIGLTRGEHPQAGACLLTHVRGRLCQHFFFLMFSQIPWPMVADHMTGHGTML
jgi:hypothetical protein